MGGLFGIERRPSVHKELAQAKREAERDARALEDIKRLADSVSRRFIVDDERAMLNTIVGGAMHRAVSEAEPSTFTFNDIVLPEAELKTIAFIPQLNPEPPSERAKLFRRQAGDLNLYLTLLVELLHGCYRGRGHLKAAIAILDQFHPAQFKDGYNEDNIRLRLKDFSKRPGVEGHIDAMTKWLLNDAVMELCPLPNFSPTCRHLPSQIKRDRGTVHP